MDEGDRSQVAVLLGESPERLRDDFMVSLVAEMGGTIVAVLRGWLGHPLGHVEQFDVNREASERQRYMGSVKLLRTFEGLLDAIGATGWTAQTNAENEIMVKFLTRHGASALPGQQVVFVREWR